MRLAELTDLLRRDLGESLAHKVLEAICRAAPGETLYIPRRAEQPAVAHADTVKTVVGKYGVSVSTAYRWVDKWRR